MSDHPTTPTTISALDAAEADPKLRAQRELAWQALFGGPPPACAKLLAAADEVIGMAKELQAAGRDADAIACALFANEYVRAARAMQEMYDAANG